MYRVRTIGFYTTTVYEGFDYHEASYVFGTMSIGASGPMAGLSFGITKVDKGCERRSGAALLYQMGYSEAAIKLLSNDPEIREALGLPPQAKATETVASQPVSPAMIQGGN